MMKFNYKKILIVAAAMVAISASVGADNLVQNPGFENWTGGQPDNWSNDNGITVEQCNVADSVHEGSYSARITLTTQSQSNADFYSDEFAVTAGAIYEISAWIFDDDPAGKGRLAVWWYDASHSYLSSDYLKYSSDSPDWQQIIDTVTAPSNAAYAKFDIRFYDVSSNWDGDALFYVDDVEFSPPSTNQPPTISNIQQSPSNPTSSDDVTVTADISDPDGDNIAKDSLWYRVFHAGSWSDWTGLYHTSTSPYTYTIPAQANHDSVEYYIIAEDDQGNRTESDHSVYYVSDDPVIQNVQQSPATPTSSDVVTVTADITDPNDDIAMDSLFYTTNGGTTYTQLYHSSVSGNTYTYEIPALPDGTTVEYFVMAKDNDGNRVTSDTFSYTVTAPYLINTSFEPDDGWERHSSGDWTDSTDWGIWEGHDIYLNSSSSYARTGDRYIGMNDSSDWFMTPPKNHPGKLTFWYRASSSSSSTPFKIIIQKRVGSNGSWIDIDTLDPSSGSTTYEKYEVNINVDEDSVFLRWYMLHKSKSFYMDDVTLTEYQPPSTVGENSIKPFTSVTIRTLTFKDGVEFIIPYKKPVEIEIYTADGRRKITLSGEWRVRLITRGLKSGIYFALAKTDGRIIGKTKFIVVH